MKYTVMLDYADGDLHSAEPSWHYNDLEEALRWRDTVLRLAREERWEGLRTVFVMADERKWID